MKRFNHLITFLSFIFVLCFFTILLHATVGVCTQKGLIANVSLYPPRMNPGQATTVTVMVIDSNNNPVHGANVQIRAPQEGYFEQTKSRFSVGFTNQSGMYQAVWRASPTKAISRPSPEYFYVTATKKNYHPWRSNYRIIIDDGKYNY